MSSDKDNEKTRIREQYKVIGQSRIKCILADPEVRFRDDTSYKRVAVYARVGTKDVKQTTSYEVQRSYYEDMVNKHKGWDLVGIYIDEGIYSTSFAHRDNFKKMIDDCYSGKIDIVITKSISRFSRNLDDCVDTIRKLAALPRPVGVLFEIENLYTLDATSEMLLAVFSTVEQEESCTKS